MRSPFDALRSAPLATIGLATLLAFGLSACDGDGDGITSPGGVDLGSANFQQTAATGNSLSMGISDGAVFETAQRCSPPALLASQAGIEDFEMPIVSDPGIGGFPPGSSGGRLQIVSLDPLVIERATPPGSPQNLDLPRPYNNLAVGGALLAEAMVADSRETSLTGNPVFDLVLRGQGTWLDQLRELEASFLVLELSHNDVLLWAAAGGDDALAPGLPVAVEDFALIYQIFFSNVSVFVDQIVVSNLADVTLAPFFTTIPPVVIDPSTGQPVIGPDGNPVPLIGPDGPLSLDDLVLLTALPLLQQGVGIPEALGGTGLPLPDAVVLNVAEQAVSRGTLDGYNAVIAGTAQATGVPVWDIAGLLVEAASGGIEADGEVLTDDFITGGAFSLDGIHPTCKGYGVMANRLIELVNAEFGAAIPTVDISELPGVPLPSGVSADALRAGTEEGLGLPTFDPPMTAEDFRLDRAIPEDAGTLTP